MKGLFLILGQFDLKDLALFSFILVLVLFGLLFYFFIMFWKTAVRKDVSPYVGTPLRHANEIPYNTKDKVLKFLKDFNNFENRPFDFDRAALCRDTGRVFSSVVTFTGAIKIDWSFIAKRYPGNYVSWGSLSKELQEDIRKSHETLQGFQTDFSSKNPSPRLVDESFAYAKPGPLYVDPVTKVLIGWMEVPDTSLEVLIVQKPIQVKFISFNQEKK